MKVFKKNAFTLIELLVVISIIALLIGILLPALGAARRTARSMQSNTQIRGIQQGMFIYSSSNKDLFPGMVEKTLDANAALVDADRIKTYSDGGSRAGGHVAGRYAICLEDNLFTPEYALSPFEVNGSVQEWDENTVYTDATGQFYSFALPRIWWSGNIMSQGRAYEWRAEANASAVVVTDRLYSSISAVFTPATYLSLQNSDEPGNWTGGVSYNDNHTETQLGGETDGPLSYAGYSTVGVDNIFSPGQPTGQQSPLPQNNNQFNAQQIIHGLDGLFFSGE